MPASGSTQWASNPADISINSSGANLAAAGAITCLEYGFVRVVAVASGQAGHLAYSRAQAPLPVSSRFPGARIVRDSDESTETSPMNRHRICLACHCRGAHRNPRSLLRLSWMLIQRVLGPDRDVV